MIFHRPGWSHLTTIHFLRFPEKWHADGVKLDGRYLEIDWATEKDFKVFGWRWFESRSRGRSRTPQGSFSALTKKAKHLQKLSCSFLQHDLACSASKSFNLLVKKDAHSLQYQREVQPEGYHQMPDFLSLQVQVPFEIYIPWVVKIADTWLSMKPQKTWGNISWF